jgi:hypothetical protein
MMKTLNNNNTESNIRRRLDFSNEESKPKRHTTSNVHMFLNAHQNKPKSMISDPNMNVMKSTSTTTDNIENVNNCKKENSPRETTTEDQKYAGGGYSKSPNPKALGKPGIQSPLKNKTTEELSPNSKREYNHTISAPSLGPMGSNSQSNFVRYDSESFFKKISQNIK